MFALARALFRRERFRRRSGIVKRAAFRTRSLTWAVFPFSPSPVISPHSRGHGHTCGIRSSSLSASFTKHPVRRPFTGLNVGRTPASSIYSGTVAAAREGALWGVRSIVSRSAWAVRCT